MLLGVRAGGMAPIMADTTDTQTKSGARAGRHHAHPNEKRVADTT